ncbi:MULTISPECIES: FeoA family protein [Aeromonas]|jgi:ferrous iron transport protein A|uniref:FeoA family protein n=1 Tax=Aeromonas media TaxID=651 RepID=A0AAP6L2Y8_AERME|nr:MULTISPECIES: FeoA family protein [Aeromonas]MBL0512398.1 ferrous iron transport protein A [Aeromonas media]MCK2084232.1 ferrous iron transport protein A [Aeromonas genomosp. paramedia]MDX7901043.1 FeoA family protein [Aeromonas media]MDX7924176.1 FeoA family protein [Aeromonas media]QJT27211.1 ferrous iron transport protein A [Aeromonas media]
MVLTELSPGQRARIKNMNQLGRALRRKLMVMGLLPQTEILYLRAAPLGDPLQIQCQGICLSMQKSLAQQIEVEPV